MKKDMSSSNKPIIIELLQQFTNSRYSYSNNNFFYYAGESDIVRPIINDRIYPNDKWCLIYSRKGTAQLVCDKQQHFIEAPCIVATPPYTLLENLVHKVGKTEIIVIVSSDTSLENPFRRFTIIPLDNDKKEIVDKHFNLLEQSIRHSYNKDIAFHLIDALLIGLKSLAKDTDYESAVNDNKKHLYNHFVDLAIEHGLTQRNIPFYAKELQITPNYLSAVVKSESGMTVIEWLNQRIIREAKVLLLHSEKAVYEVAANLGFNNTSFFIKFFKRETGLSPRAYRTKKNLELTRGKL